MTNSDDRSIPRQRRIGVLLDRLDERRFLLGLVVLAAVLRFLYLGYQSIWIDEILTIGQSTPKDGYSIWHLLLHNIHGPLHSFVVYLFRLVHDGDAWLRVPSAAAGVAGVALFYAWAARWLDRRLARVAALLLALHPLHVHYSQEVRNYAFLFLFAMSACYAFERFCERPTRGRGAGYVLAMAAAALSNFTAAFLFVAHSVIYFIRGGVGGATVRRWVGVGALTLVLISPWVYRIYTFIDVKKLVTPVLPGQLETTERLRGETTVGWSVVPYTFYAYSVGFTMGPSLRELHADASLRAVLARHWPAVAWVGVMFGTLALWGAVRGGRGRRREWLELGVYLAAPLVLTLALNWQNAKAFNLRYVLLGMPAFLCLVAAGICRLRRANLALLACVATMVTSLAHYYFDGRYAKEDVKRATRYVEERLESSGAEGCIFAPTVIRVVERYLEGNVPTYSAFQREWLTRDRVDAQLAPLFAACNSVWYVRARAWVDDYNDYLLHSVESRYTVVEEARFDGVEVFHFQRKNGGGPGG